MAFGGAKRRREEEDGDVGARLLAEAEAAHADERGLAIDGEKGLRRALASAARRYEENVEKRSLFGDKPDKFMDSEVSLATEVERISSVAATPALLPFLLSSSSSSAPHSSLPCLSPPLRLFFLLLSHENTDLAVMAARFLRELTDEDTMLDPTLSSFTVPAPSLADAGGGGKEAKKNLSLPTAIASLMRDGGVPALLVALLGRLDERVAEEAEGVEDLLGLGDNMQTLAALETVELGGEVKGLGFAMAESKLVKWIVWRVQCEGVDGTKAAAADLLATMLQENELAREKLGNRGIESLLQSLAQFRSRLPADEEEEEVLENIAGSIASAVLYSENKLLVTEAEGVELLLMLLKKKGKMHAPMLQALDFVLTRNTPGCEHLVQAGGLGVIFSIFMGKTRAQTAEDRSKDEARSVSILFSLFQGLPQGKLRNRLCAKLVESEFEKCDRLVELFIDLEERDKELVQARRRHASVTGEALSEEDLHEARMQGSLCAYQQIGMIIGHAYAIGHTDIQVRLLTLLRQNNKGLRDIRLAMDGYAEEIGQGDGIEAQEKRRSRVHQLQQTLYEPGEEVGI